MSKEEAITKMAYKIRALQNRVRELEIENKKLKEELDGKKGKES